MGHSLDELEAGLTDELKACRAALFKDTCDAVSSRGQFFTIYYLGEVAVAFQHKSFLGSYHFFSARCINMFIRS